MTVQAKKLEWRPVSDTSYLASIEDGGDYGFGYAQIEYVKVPGFDAFRWSTRLQCLEGISGTWWFDSPEQAKAEIQRKLDEFVRAIVEEEG